VRVLAARKLRGKWAVCGERAAAGEGGDGDEQCDEYGY